jgi:hypothetical protein
MKKIIGTILLLLILFVTFMIYGSYGEGYRAENREMQTEVV